MRDLAIRNTHPTVVSIDKGVIATDKDGKKIKLNESLIGEEIDRLKILKDNKERAGKLKREGRDYELNGKIYKVSFTTEDQNALLAIKVGFEDFGLTETNFKFSNGTVVKIKNTEFSDLASFFVVNRSSFFK